MNAATATTVEAPTGKASRGVLRRGKGTATTVSFPELVWMHHLRQQELKNGGREPYSGPAEHRSREFVRRFEAEHGPIVDSYWCTTEAFGVALTAKWRPWILPDGVRPHWATDWATKDQPALMQLLYRCEALAVRVHEALRRYAGGMLLGTLPLVLLIVLALVLGLADTHSTAVRIGLVCFAAGFSERFAQDMLLGSTAQTIGARTRQGRRQPGQPPPDSEDPLGPLPAEGS